MSDIKTLEDKINAKLRMLDFTEADTSKILKTRDVKAIKRHGSALESIINKVHQHKLQVQELRLEKSDNPEEVRLWTRTLEDKVSKFEEALKKVKHVAAGIKSDEEERCRDENRKQMLDKQIELERAKLEKSVKGSSWDSEKLTSLGAKLPKLVITKFQGTYLDWIRFWNQFETEIDKANLTQVAKFSYLKELLVPSVFARPSMDCPSQLRVTQEPKQY